MAVGSITAFIHYGLLQRDTVWWGWGQHHAPADGASPAIAEEEHVSGVSQEFNWWKMSVTGTDNLFSTKYLWKITASCVTPVCVSATPMMVSVHHPPFAKHLFTDHKVCKKNCSSASLWFPINGMVQRMLSNSMWTMKAISCLRIFQVAHKLWSTIYDQLGDPGRNGGVLWEAEATVKTESIHVK